MKVQLIDESRVWYKLWSNQAAIISSLVMIQGLLPYWEGIVEPRTFMIIGAILNSLVFVLRNIKQPKLTKEKTNA